MPETMPLCFVTFCERCHALCRTGKPDPRARMLRQTDQPEGYCLECAMTEWLQITPPICYQLGKGHHVDKREAEYCRRTGFDKDLDGNPRDLAMLKNPQVRELIAHMMQTALAQAEEPKINWNKIIENWELPLVTRRRKGRKR